MAKKETNSPKKKGSELTKIPEPISKRGWKIIGGGVGGVLIGFLVLSLTDPRGQNFASKLSPFLILGGYATIALGIIAKDPVPPTQ